MIRPGSFSQDSRRFIVPNSSYKDDKILLKQLNDNMVQKGHLKNDPNTTVYAVREYGVHQQNTVQVAAPYNLSSCTKYYN